MARKARILVKEGAAGVYHICSRTAGAIGTYPLEDKENRYQLLKYIKHYASLYQCEVYGFVIMGNHYHLILRFFKPKKLSKSFLQQKALQFYPKSASLIGLWGDEKWAVFEKRLFSLAAITRDGTLDRKNVDGEIFKDRIVSR